MNDLSERDDLNGLRFLCRHLVALCISYRLSSMQPSDPARFFACAGTLISFNNTLHFLTAGHILENLLKPLDSGHVAGYTCVLADTFGKETITTVPIPFDLSSAPKFYIHEDGLDFGLIGLSNYYARLLAANGIKVLSRENWEHQDAVEFDGYAMLGLPEHFISSTERLEGSAVSIQATLAPTLITLQRLTEVPTDVEPTAYPRFVGKIDQSLQIDNIVGMSGGPIFGFARNPLRYWVVAIQSSWLRKRRITFGCPMPVFANLVRQLFDYDAPGLSG